MWDSNPRIPESKSVALPLRQCAMLRQSLNPAACDILQKHHWYIYVFPGTPVSVVTHLEEIWVLDWISISLFWHSPQLKQGDSCFSHYCIGKHLTVLQCLTQCPQAIFILFPYALRYSFYLYADCICSPFFRIINPYWYRLSRDFMPRPVRDERSSKSIRRGLYLCFYYFNPLYQYQRN